ncbi:RNA polymerase sigma-70 factor, partial [Nocardia cyriacigeorgica]|nr:RNA polymerase sigma-70 factor [Nocardia cyriacigeorgica]
YSSPSARSWGRMVLVNGRPGLVVFDGTHTGVFSFTVEAGQITAIDVIRNPDKLHDLPESGEPWFMNEVEDDQPTD